MKIKSAVVSLVLISVVIVVFVFSLQRCGVVGLLSYASVTPTPSGTTSSAAIKYAPNFNPALASDPQQTGTQDPNKVGIVGLELQLARPLLFDAQVVRGLAATPDFFYVGSYLADKKQAILFQVYRNTYTIAQERVYERNGRYRFGGLHVGPDGLMAPLIGDEDNSSEILAIGLQSLEVTGSFVVPDQIRAVAQGPDGSIYGINESSELFYKWDTNGHVLKSAANTLGTSYYDMAIVRGSLVCSGILRSQAVAVLDIIDPATFNLLTRHFVYAHSTANRWVTYRGFDSVNGEFFFLPDDGRWPLLLTYVLQDTMTIEEYVPNTGG